jgi:SAM-dependent methyltransferase
MADEALDHLEAAYPLVLRPEMTPDGMQAALLMHGYRGPDPATASVLEIAGASGIASIAIAAAWPRSRCVSFDLSAAAIGRGRQLAAAARLDNVRLEEADILTYPLEGEPFDYIICHGVHSWVPQPVRDAILRLMAARLAPGGVAYIGYDCLPAAAAKYAIVQYLVASTAGIADLAERVDRAVGLAAVLLKNQRENSRLKNTLELLVDNAPRFMRGYVMQDWLVPQYAPISIRDLAQAAAAHGLAYFGDGSLSDLFVNDLDQQGLKLLKLAGEDPVRRNETLDLLRGSRAFRTDHFVRASHPPPGGADPVRSLSYCFMGTAQPDGEGGFIRYDRGNVSAIVPPGERQQITELLRERAPDELGYEAISEATGIPDERLEQLLLPDSLPFLERHATPQPFVTVPGERPRASRLARAMAVDRSAVVSLRHERIDLPDLVMRSLLVLADGTRTDAQIADEVSGTFGRPATAGQVREAIGRLAARRLFEA